MTYRAPKGTSDILPPESRAWRRAILAWEELCERYGYDLALVPIFEATEVFARGVGGDTEIVQKQMYTFDDKGGRSLTLRPEATASVVRSYLQSGAQGTVKVATWGPFFRYERPQKGRQRQFYQLDAEYLGEPSPDADVEIIELGYRLLQTVGVGDAVVYLNSIGDPDDRRVYREALVAYLEERRDRLSPDSRRRIKTNPLRVLDSKEDAGVISDPPATIDYLGPESAQHFDTVREGLKRVGIPYDIEPRLVRGLDYYSRTVFEYVPESYEAAQSAVGGGGRYDGLAELLGGPSVPGVGVAMGLDRIMLAASDQPQPALDAFVVVADRERRYQALEVVARLREAGLRTDLDLGDRSVRAQFRAADRRDAKAGVVVGAEYDQGQLTVRDMASGRQRQLDLEGTTRWLKEL